MFPPRVVITGLGALTPIGNNVKEYWHGLMAGKSGAGLITRFDASKFNTQFACELKAFDPYAYLPSKQVKRMDRFTQYAMVAGAEAVEDARLMDAVVDRSRVGVIWGSGIGGLGTTEETVLESVRNGMGAKINPFFIPKIIPDIPAGYLSMEYGFKGPNFATVAACTSSLNALVAGFQLIKLGEAEVVLTGGSEAPIIPVGLGGFSALKALSQRNQDYLTASCPFDKTRDGFVMGEGAGALVLESYAHARKRNAKIYAEMVGAGMSADAYHITAPDMDGVMLALQRALTNAHLTADCIDYINAHGTSTPLGDINEIKAIQEVFGKDIFQLNISSTKSMTGHLLGAAGAIESIATVLALQHQWVPPTINHKIVDEAIDSRINLTLHHAVQRAIRFAQNNAFGFGGHNVSIVFKKWEDS